MAPRSHKHHLPGGCPRPRDAARRMPTEVPIKYVGAVRGGGGGTLDLRSVPLVQPRSSGTRPAVPSSTQTGPNSSRPLPVTSGQEWSGASARSESLVEAIADRVAERLADIARDPVRLYDTRAVARMLAVSEDWVREHAAELGAMRVGDSPRGPLRFDCAKVLTAIEHRRVGQTEAARSARGAGPGRSRGVRLLPLPTESA